jgi:hypothetical protein
MSDRRSLTGTFLAAETSAQRFLCFQRITPRFLRVGPPRGHSKSLGVALKRAYSISFKTVPRFHPRSAARGCIGGPIPTQSPPSKRRSPEPRNAPREIPFSTPQPGYRDRTLPFQKSDDRRHWAEWRYTYVHGPASDVLPGSGIPFVAPVHGKSVPIAVASGRRSLAFDPSARITHDDCSPISNG